MVYFFKLLIDTTKCIVSLQFYLFEGPAVHCVLLIGYCLLHSGKETYFVWKKMFPVMFFCSIL